MEAVPDLAISLVGQSNSVGSIVFDSSSPLCFHTILHNVGRLRVGLLRVKACLEYRSPPLQECNK
jgi:hypothetical protein